MNDERENIQYVLFIASARVVDATRQTKEIHHYYHIIPEGCPPPPGPYATNRRAVVSSKQV